MITVAPLFHPLPAAALTPPRPLWCGGSWLQAGGGSTELTNQSFRWHSRNFLLLLGVGISLALVTILSIQLLRLRSRSRHLLPLALPTERLTTTVATNTPIQTPATDYSAPSLTSPSPSAPLRSKVQIIKRFVSAPVNLRKEEPAPPPPPFEEKKPRLSFQEVFESFAADTYKQYSPEEASDAIAYHCQKQRAGKAYDLDNPQSYPPFETILESLDPSSPTDQEFLGCFIEKIPHDVWKQGFVNTISIEFRFYALLKWIPLFDPQEHFALIEALIESAELEPIDKKTVFSKLSLSHRTHLLPLFQNEAPDIIKKALNASLQGNKDALKFVKEGVLGSEHGDLPWIRQPIERFFNNFFENIEFYDSDIITAAEILGQVGEWELAVSGRAPGSEAPLVSSPVVKAFWALVKAQNYNERELFFDLLFQKVPFEVLRESLANASQRSALEEGFHALKYAIQAVQDPKELEYLQKMIVHCKPELEMPWVEDVLREASDEQVRAFIVSIGPTLLKGAEIIEEIFCQRGWSTEEAVETLDHLAEQHPEFRKGLINSLYRIHDALGRFYYESLPVNSPLRIWHSRQPLKKDGPIPQELVSKLAEKVFPHTFEGHRNWSTIMDLNGREPIKDPKAYLRTATLPLRLCEELPSPYLRDLVNREPRLLSRFKSVRHNGTPRAGNGVYLPPKRAPRNNRHLNVFEPRYSAYFRHQAGPTVEIPLSHEKDYERFHTKWSEVHTEMDLQLPAAGEVTGNLLKNMVVAELFTLYFTKKGFKSAILARHPVNGGRIFVVFDPNNFEPDRY